MTKIPKYISRYFSKIGKLGASKGGIASAAAKTPEQRSANARRAVAAREAKRAERKRIEAIL